MQRQPRREWVASGAVFAVGLALGTWANDRGSALGSSGPGRAARVGPSRPLWGRDTTDVPPGFADLTPEAARRLGLAPGSPGAVVLAVVPGSVAARASLRVDDVILEVDHRAVRGEAGGEAALRAARGPGAVTLRVWRDGRPLLITLPHP
ncbi:MAG: PDZ domain-containing protein [Vicinamibacterales bacterium]